MTMGTASTMASMVEALGMSCRATRRFPQSMLRRYALAQKTGRRIVQMSRRICAFHKFSRAQRSRTRSVPTPPSVDPPMQ